VCSGFGVGHGIQVAFEQVQARRPQLPVRLQPGVDGAQRFGTQVVDALLCIRPDFDQAGVAEDTQMLGDRRLADGEVVDERADGQIRAPEQVENAASVWLGEDLESQGVPGSLEYSYQAI